MSLRRLTLLVVGIALLLCASSPLASAHALRPATLALKELRSGHFLVSWVAPLTGSGLPLEGDPVFPDHCQLADTTLDCGARGLAGALFFPSLARSGLGVMIRIEWLGGLTSARTLSPGSLTLQVHGTPSGADLAALSPLAFDYTLLGVQHILSGWDHLLFVLGLVLLVGFGRELLWTVTAFTLAHSVTLASAALGAVRVPQAPVEATIALSLLLVALECARPRHSIARRKPWLVAFAFGLLHGFGFAGALAEVGLPPHQRALALLFFNGGVELGQLGCIAATWLASLALHRYRPVPSALRGSLVYALGALAAFWSIERSVVLWAG